jgi:hypothetical protein
MSPASHVVGLAEHVVAFEQSVRSLSRWTTTGGLKAGSSPR